MSRILSGLMSTLLLAAVTPVAAQTWPEKAVKFIVPSTAGSGTDLFGRLTAAAVSPLLKQSFVVENLPGASGNIGAAAAAKSPPDGYTFLVSADPSLTVNQSLYKNLPYNAERDFAPVSRGVWQRKDSKRRTLPRWFAKPRKAT